MLVVWSGALLGPFVAAAGAWLLMSAGASARACATGEGSTPLLVSIAVITALDLATPVALGCYGWRKDLYSPRVAVAIVTSSLLALPLIFIAAQLWWTGHNCMT